jgi:hypothetical protein
MQMPRFSISNALILLMLFFIAAFSRAGEDAAVQERIVPELRASRVNPAPPVIDGDLEDPIWQRTDLDLARNFIQREPDEGQPATGL